jgi:hypothetical protein
MELPKVKKQLWDLLPKVTGLGGPAKHLATGLLAITIGAFGSTGQPTVPAPSPSPVSVSQDRATQDSGLVLHQPAASPQMHAQHWSHSSHSSHASHSSHSSHYSSG